jgi:hypothetical protein
MNLRELIGQKPIMLVPTLQDLDDYLKEDLVRQICRKCAIQLSVHLFIWKKEFALKDTIKTWCPIERKFLGMDLSLFQEFMQDHFSVRTADHQEWLLDRSIADRIWSECITENSPLPDASWAIEAQKRRAA